MKPAKGFMQLFLVHSSRDPFCPKSASCLCIPVLTSFPLITIPFHPLSVIFLSLDFREHVFLVLVGLYSFLILQEEVHTR